MHCNKWTALSTIDFEADLTLSTALVAKPRFVSGMHTIAAQNMREANWN
jgi:hypothetical protein